MLQNQRAQESKASVVDVENKVRIQSKYKDVVPSASEKSRLKELWRKDEIRR